MRTRTRSVRGIAAGALVTAGLLVGPAQSASAATCSYSWDRSGPFELAEYAGNYWGVTAVPSTTRVTSSGAEAQ